MAARIEVSRVREGEFLVTVVEGPTQSKHSVTLKEQDYVRLSGGTIIEPEDLIAKSFEFLLKRESKESILARFDLLDITRYFPTFERDMQRKLGMGLGEQTRRALHNGDAPRLDRPCRSKDSLMP